MSFIQIIDARTKNFDEISALDAEYEKSVAGRSTFRRSIACRDRNDPERYFILVFFDSYEDAMQNSTLPETQALAEKMMGLVEAPPNFYDLDIIEDKSS
jgi:hypothetical protein